MGWTAKGTLTSTDATSSPSKLKASPWPKARVEDRLAAPDVERQPTRQQERDGQQDRRGPGRECEREAERGPVHGSVREMKSGGGRQCASDGSAKPYRASTPRASSDCRYS
jgi:hypothetical protein